MRYDFPDPNTPRGNRPLLGVSATSAELLPFALSEIDGEA